MRLLIPDANEGSGTPSAPATGDVNKATASSAEKPSTSGPASPKTLTDALNAEFASDSETEGQEDESESDPIIGSDEETEETSRSEEDASADGESQAETEEETEEESVDESEEEGEAETPPPFHKHPRWQKMVKERDELRQQYEAAQPLVEQQQSIIDYCSQHDISAEQFQSALKLQALINTNPEAAVKELKPLMEQLGQFDGSSLPADLEEKVASGRLELEDAQELAKLRANNEKGTRTQKKTQEEIQRERYRRTQEANFTAVKDWETSIQKSDPDFRQKAKDTDTDGLYELVAAKFQSAAMGRPPQSPQEVVKLLTESYNSVKKVFTTRLARKQPLKKPLQSSSRNQGPRKEPENLMDAVVASVGSTD
jgi:hypothetical protein